MKVSWAVAKGGWMGPVQERGGRRRLLVWCPAALLPWHLLPVSLPVVRWISLCMVPGKIVD